MQALRRLRSLIALALVAGPLAPHHGSQLPPTATDAGGANVPNLGMQELEQGGGLLKTEDDIPLLPGQIAPVNPAPLGWVYANSKYGPDYAGPAGDQLALDALLALGSAAEYPQDLWLSNTDPSGSLDESAVDTQGDPIHFNLHWPQAKPDAFWLSDIGLAPNSPTEDLEQIAEEILLTGSKARIPEALDILLGTNSSGALTGRAYEGFELLHIQGARDNQTFDPVTRNVEVTQIWYGNEIRSDAHLLQLPVHGDYTITWKVRGLGDPGADRSRAFPIDEFAPHVMKMSANAGFWLQNSWVWKWLAVVQHPTLGRKYALESLWQAHTGTPLDGAGQPVPSYDQLAPGDPRTWLYANRRFDMGSFVGESDIQDTTPWKTLDLDLDGQIGGHLVDGTDTGLPYDATTNPNAQFNQYGNNEYGVPVLDWSRGPAVAPHFSYDSSFTTVRKGQGFDVTIRYGQGLNQTGIYNWGWRVHPPRIHWIETYGEDEILPGGAPKSWRYGHKWEEVESLGLAAIGDFAPEKVLHTALVDYQASAGAPADVTAFGQAVDGLFALIHDRRTLPPTPGVVGFPDPAADANLCMSNLDIWGDRSTIGSGAEKSWDEGDTLRITVYNDDNVTRFFRIVDFGTTDYQYNGTDLGRLDWKPVYGVPQFVAQAWAGGFGPQSAPLSHWVGGQLDGLGNPFYVDPLEQDLANYWPAGERDLTHEFQTAEGFSGPGFHAFVPGSQAPWGHNGLAGQPTGSAGLWDYAYGAPIPPKTVKTFQIEVSRAQALNNGALYVFDPQFHFTGIYTMHPRSESEVEGLIE